MKITKTSILTGVTRTREIGVTKEQLAEWNKGALIQDAMPNLSDSDRKFIMTGISDDEWDSAFSIDDED